MPIEKELSYPAKPDKFSAVCSEIFGDNWREILSEKLHVHYRSVKNWETGRVSVPGSVVFALNLLQSEKKGVK